MKFHITVPHPLGEGTLRIENVVVTKVHEDGTFDFTDDQFPNAYCNPDVFKVYDENENPVIPSIPSLALSAEALQKQLLETWAALAAIYETLTGG